jgi:hypothetical protein
MERKKTGRHLTKKTNVAVLEKPQDMKARVREFAYSLYEKRGYASGNDRQDWLEAEETAYDRKKG